MQSNGGWMLMAFWFQHCESVMATPVIGQFDIRGFMVFRGFMWSCAWRYDAPGCAGWDIFIEQVWDILLPFLGLDLIMCMALWRSSDCKTSGILLHSHLWDVMIRFPMCKARGGSKRQLDVSGPLQDGILTSHGRFSNCSKKYFLVIYSFSPHEFLNSSPSAFSMIHPHNSYYVYSVCKRQHNAQLHLQCLNRGNK